MNFRLTICKHICYRSLSNDLTPYSVLLGYILSVNNDSMSNTVSMPQLDQTIYLKALLCFIEILKLQQRHIHLFKYIVHNVLNNKNDPYF